MQPVPSGRRRGRPRVRSGRGCEPASSRSDPKSSWKWSKYRVYLLFYRRSTHGGAAGAGHRDRNRSRARDFLGRNAARCVDADPAADLCAAHGTHGRPGRSVLPGCRRHPPRRGAGTAGAGSEERVGLERAYADALQDFHRGIAELAAAADTDLHAALGAAVLAFTPTALAALRALAADLSLLKDWERAESDRAARQDPPDPVA